MITEFTDSEREDLPSASSLERTALCAGSPRESRGLPEILSPDMKRYSESGDRAHLWLSAPDMIDLSPWPDELEIAQSCLKLRQDVARKVFGEIQPGDLIEGVEQRFWHYGPSAPALRDHVKKFSGKLDYWAYHSGQNKLLVVDYKSGRGDQTEASSNLQLRSQMVLLAENLTSSVPVIGVGPLLAYTAIIQPLVSHEPEICQYGPAEISAAQRELRAILIRADDPKAKLTPGEKQCKFCPARLKCKAAATVLQEVHDTKLTALIGLAPSDMAALLEKCAVADILIKSARSHAKAHLKDKPDCIPGWTLSPNPSIREINDAEAAFNALVGFGMTSKVFLSECCSVSIGAIEKAVKELAEGRNEKCTKKMATEIVNTNCAKLITMKPKEPSLEKVKP